MTTTFQTAAPLAERRSAKTSGRIWPETYGFAGAKYPANKALFTGVFEPGDGVGKKSNEFTAEGGHNSGLSDTETQPADGKGDTPLHPSKGQRA